VRSFETAAEGGEGMALKNLKGAREFPKIFFHPGFRNISNLQIIFAYTLKFILLSTVLMLER
jgi:hypothetical protein